MLTFNELKIHGRKYYPAILLDQFLNYKHRVKLRKILLILISIVFVLMVLAPYSNSGLLAILLPVSLSNYWFNNLFEIRGLIFILTPILLSGYFFEFFYKHYYSARSKIEYEVAKLAYISKTKDLTASFMNSEIGRYTMSRLGLHRERIEQFLDDETREKIEEQDVLFKFNARKDINDEERVINLPDYVKSIYDKDLDLQYYLEKNHISEEDLFGSLKWVQNILYKIRSSEKLFSRERLIRISTIGRNWYVEDYDYIKKYCHLIYENKFYQSLEKDWHLFRNEAEQVEDLLIDQEKSNVILITRRNSTSMQIIATFAKMIAHGVCVHEFENKKLFVLNTDILKLHNEDSQKFEITFRKIVEQIANTRNIILIIPELPKLVEIANELELDIVEILNKIIDKVEVPIITTAKENDYREVLASDLSFNKQFDKYYVPNIDENFLIKILEEEALKIEMIDKTLISYQRIKEIARKYQDTKDGIKKSLVELHRIKHH